MKITTLYTYSRHISSNLFAVAKEFEFLTKIHKERPRIKTREKMKSNNQLQI